MEFKNIEPLLFAAELDFSEFRKKRDTVTFSDVSFDEILASGNGIDLSGLKPDRKQREKKPEIVILQLQNMSVGTIFESGDNRYVALCRNLVRNLATGENEIVSRTMSGTVIRNILGNRDGIIPETPKPEHNIRDIAPNSPAMDKYLAEHGGTKANKSKPKFRRISTQFLQNVKTGELVPVNQT